MTTYNPTDDISRSISAEIESMHARTVHWNSAFEFYGIELRFLKSLVAKYSIWLENNDMVRDFNSCEQNIVNLELKCADIVQLLHKHGRGLRNLMAEPLRHDIQACREAQLKIEMRHIELLKQLLGLRKATFDMVEAALDTQELIHIS
jgi:hypothetical protein